MVIRALVLLLLTPFVIVFAYATWHEFRRYKREGRSTYGLGYDPETGSTHVMALNDNQESYVHDTDASEQSIDR